ncbi:hypothetical protein ACWDLL_09405 [Streptomyces griseoincarnatus]
MREKRAQRKIRHDRELIAFGARYAARNEHMPVRCEECDRFGPSLGGVVARTDRGVSILDAQCAREGGHLFLTLAECIDRAAALGISLRDTSRKASPITALVVSADEYANAATLINAKTGKSSTTHIANLGAKRRRG